MKKFALVFVFLFASLFSFSANYYWVGGSGSWSQISHWATSSGGSTFHSSVPGASDDVYFDANSFTSGSNLLTVNVAVNCRNLDFSAVTNSPIVSGSSALNIYGSLILHSSLTWNESGLKRLYGTGTHTIDYAGNTEKSTITFNGTGTFTLADSIYCQKNITVYHGTITTANHKISAPRISCYAISNITLNLGTSILYSQANLLHGTDYGVSFRGTASLTADADESTIIIGSTGQFSNFYSDKTIDFGTIEMNGEEKIASLGPSSSVQLLHFKKYNGWGQIPSTSTNIDIENLIAEDEMQLQPATTIGKADVQADFTTNNNVTIDTLLLSALNGPSSYQFAAGKTLTITDSLYLNPGTCYESRTLKSTSNSISAGISKSGNSINIDYVILENVTATGGASFNATNVPFTGGDVSGWNVSNLTPLAYYWVAGSGNFSDPTSWSLTSGGTPQASSACIPTSADSVFFDANSFGASSQVVTIDTPSFCGYMKWDAPTNTPTLDGVYDLTINGDLYADASMVWDLNSTLHFTGGGNHEIDFAGLKLIDTMNLSASGTYTLADTLHSDKSIFFYTGEFFTDDYKIHAENMRMRGTDTLKMNLGTSKIELDWNTNGIDSRTLYSDHDALVFNGSQSRFYLNGAGTYTSFYSHNTLNIQSLYLSQNAETVDLDDGSIDSIFCLSATAYANIGEMTCDYVNSKGDVVSTQASTYGVCIVEDDFETQAALTCDTLRLTCKDGYAEYKFNSGSTLTINDGLVFPSGSCSETYQIRSSELNETATILQNGGTVTANYAILNSISATGTATFNSTNTISEDGNNSGWSISDLTGTSYYWVGNTGNWSDPTNWSFSSGGTPQGAGGCLPTGADNVYFDANSFSSGSSTVTLDATAQCKDMDWTNAGFNPTLTGSSNIHIFGDLEAISTLSWSLNTGTFFVGTGSHTIDFANLTAAHNIKFENSGTFSLESDISTDEYLHFNQGTITTNNYQLHASRIYSTGTAPVTLNWGTSLVEADWYNNTYNLYSVLFNNPNLTLNGGNSKLHINGTGSRTNIQNTSTTMQFGTILMDKASFCYVGDATADSILFESSSLCYLSIDSANLVRSNGSTTYFQSDAKIKKAEVLNNAIVNYDVTADSFLMLNNSSTVTLTIASGRTLTINDSVLINANGCFNHNITSASTGVAATISMPSGKSLETDFVSVKDITGTGGGTFNAGGNSSDLGGNTGWTFNGPSYNLSLKYNTYCIIPGQTREIKAAPDGTPSSYWWKQTTGAQDTFNTDNDTIMASSPLSYGFTSSYGPGCEFTDTIYVIYTGYASGTAQNFYNYAEDEDWNNCSNWESNLIPDSISDVTIAAGKTVTIDSDTAWCKNLTIEGTYNQTGGVLMVFGNIINNGVMNPTGGIINLHGSGTDTIGGGSNAVAFDSLVLEKNGQIVVNSSAHILANGYLNFVEGRIISSQADSLYFKLGSNSNQGTDSSFVEGPVYRYGSSSFFFPIGKNNYWGRLYISSTASSGNNTLFRAEYFDSHFSDTSNYNSPLAKVSEVEYWQLDRIAGSGTVRVSLFYEDSVRTGVSDPSKLLVAKYDGSDWSSMGAYDYNHAGGKGDVTSNYVSTFSPFTFGTSDLVNYLPVEFINVKAKWVEEDAIVTWETASEINNSHFIVERSLDNHSWTDVGLVYSEVNNSDVSTAYSFTDLSVSRLIAPLYYYRIKQVDFDQNSDYSGTVVLEKNFITGFTLAPNPTKGLVLVSTARQTGTVTIYSLYGVTLDQFELKSGTDNYAIDLSAFRKGTYIIEYDNGRRRLQKRVVLH